MSKEYPWGKGTPKWVLDATANDSDKSFTVPAGKIWDLKSVEAQLAATATVGNRLLVHAIYNSSNEIVTAGQPTAAIAASANGGYYAGVSTSDSTTGRVRLTAITATNSVQRNLSFAPVIMTAGMYVRVLDYAAVDAAADDMTVVLHYVEYDA